MKRICFLIGDLNHPAGTERVTTLIANEMSKQGYAVSILSLVNGTKPFFALESNIKTYSLYSKKISFKKNYFGATWKIRQFVKQHHIDTFIVVDSISCVFTVPAFMGLQINHICWEHFNFNVDLGVSVRRLGRRLAAKYCDYIVTLTKRDKELWLNNLGQMKASVIPIANPSPYEGIENTPNLEFKTILAVGRLTHQKGFDLLIKAWAQVCETNPDWILRIVGSGEDEAKLTSQVSELSIVDRVDFVPANKDIEQYYRTSSYYAMSSRFEGLPMVLLEAQAFGLPIIAFDCDTGPSEVVHDRLNGWLVPPQNIELLRDAILNAITISKDSHKAMVENSHSNNERFTINRTIFQWKNII